MDTRFALAALAATCFSTFAAAQMSPGMMHGAGPGMKGNPSAMGGPGDCPMGGQASGHGMRGGHMMGGGMMGGGMMGGGMMGGGMMGGGMMGGHMMGGGKMGGGMMGGPGFMALERLNLDTGQRDKAKNILRDTQRKMHALMGSMHELRWQEEDVEASGTFDAAAARKRYEAHAAIQKQMFEARLDAHKRIQDLLTQEQREKLGK